MDIFKELQEEGVDAALLEEIQRFRQAHPGAPGGGGACSPATVSLLWTGDLGERGGGSAVWGASAAGGT